MPTIHFELGEQHPVFEAAPEAFHKNIPSYAWYIRVADVPKFLNHIAPVLERRLAQSALSGFTGEIKVTEYVRGFKLKIEQGKISAEAWTPDDSDHADVPAIHVLAVVVRAALTERSALPCTPIASCRMRPRQCSKCCSRAVTRM